MNKLQKLKNKRKELLAQILEESKTFFKKESEEIFALHPKLESFSWRQYTPYFNDGEECVFSARTEDLNFVFDGKEYEEISEYLFKYRKDLPDDFAVCAKQVLKFMENFENEHLKEMFDDHAEIIVKRDDIVIEQYEHD